MLLAESRPFTPITQCSGPLASGAKLEINPRPGCLDRAMPGRRSNPACKDHIQAAGVCHSIITTESKENYCNQLQDEQLQTSSRMNAQLLFYLLSDTWF